MNLKDSHPLIVTNIHHDTTLSRVRLERNIYWFFHSSTIARRDKLTGRRHGMGVPRLWAITAFL
jgi:hypothetical protein